MVLVVAGGQKLLEPRPLVRVLRILRLPVGPMTVRGIALAEVVIGIAALVARGGVPAAVLAASYAVFTVVTLLALSPRTSLTSCGCFGRDERPATWTHAALTALAALAATVTAT